MNGLPYYKAYPRDFFEGTAGMEFEIKAAYRLLLDLIYMHGGRLVDDPRFISGHLGCSVRKWNLIRAELLQARKISADLGIISNFRADKELESLRSLQEKQRENRLGKSKNKDLAETTVKPNRNHTEPEPYYPDANASDGDAVDFAKQLFDRGVQFLSKHGTPEVKARRMIGLWRKDHPDPEIFDAFSACSKAGAVDPIPWITARLGGAKVDIRAMMKEIGNA